MCEKKNKKKKNNDAINIEKKENLKKNVDMYWGHIKQTETPNTVYLVSI